MDRTVAARISGAELATAAGGLVQNVNCLAGSPPPFPVGDGPERRPVGGFQRLSARLKAGAMKRHQNLDMEAR
jgi:hypothetical protein